MSRQVSFEMCDIRPSLVMLWPVCLTQENAEVVDPAEGNLGRLPVPAFGYCGGKTVAFFDLTRFREKRAIGIQGGTRIVRNEGCSIARPFEPRYRYVRRGSREGGRREKAPLECPRYLWGGGALTQPLPSHIFASRVLVRNWSVGINTRGATRRN